MQNPVRASSQFIVAHAKDVTLNHPRIRALAHEWSKQGFIVPSWPRSLHFHSRDERSMLDYLFILDALNFCFWQPPRSGKERWTIRYKGKEYNGYFALSLALKKFFETSPKKSSIASLARMRFEDFTKMLGGREKLLLLRTRSRILQKVSQVLVSRYHSDTQEFIHKANGSCSTLVRMIASELPSFDDTATYRGRNVYFWKRAQILVVDIYGALAGKGIGNIHGLEYLTAFADYKVPQILREFGILEYSPKLAHTVDQRNLIPAGSSKEVEIRAATIQAVELLHKALAQYGMKLLPYQIDWFLWEKSRKLKNPRPYHLTKTVFY